MAKVAKFSDYKVSKLKYSQYETRLGIGYILQCTKGDDFGIVYAYQEHGRCLSRGKTWIYFFKKPHDLFYEKFTEITFLKSSSGYDKPESFQVSDILPLSSYRIISTNDKTSCGIEQRRSDGIFHYDVEWDLMTERTPYIELSDCSISVYFPIVDPIEKSVIFHDYTVYTRNKRANIISCFIGMHDLNLYSTEPKFEFVSSKLSAISAYIERFDIESETKKFIAGQSGYFHSYPGRDDSFFTTNYRRSSSTDSYMKQLVNLHEETDYYNCCGRSEDDYDRIDIEETEKMRKEIIDKYDKDAHYMFLLTEFFAELKEQREQYLLYEEDIKSFVEERDEGMFELQYNKDDYMKVIQQYNK